MTTRSSSPDNEITLTDLTCHSTQDTTGNGDQISIEVGDKPVWGPYPMKLGEVPLNTTSYFHNSVSIELSVNDANGSKKSLGSRRALADGGSQTLEFKRFGAYYTLTYQVKEKS